MKKKIISLLLAMLVSFSQFTSISMAATSQTKAITGMSVSEFDKNLSSMGFREDGFYYENNFSMGGVRVGESRVGFLLEKYSTTFSEVIRKCFNMLLPTGGNELHSIVSNPFVDQTLIMDGRTVVIKQWDQGVTVDIYDDYKPDNNEPSNTGGNLEIGMSFSDFKKQLSGLGIKNDKYTENGKTMGYITATSTSAKFIIEQKSTKFNAVIKKALKMLFPSDSDFYYDEIINGKYENVTYDLGNREVKITRSGSKITVSISRLDIKNVKVADIPNYTYTGKNIEPTLKVEHYYGPSGDMAIYPLQKGKDYTVEFKNNKYSGTATVTIKGKGNFKGSKTVTFKIFPKKTTGVKCESYSSSSAKLTWTKQPNVSGYEVLRSTTKSGVYKTIGKVTSNTTTFTDKNLSSGKTYYYKVRAYKVIDKKNVYGINSSAYLVNTRCKTPTITLSSDKKKSSKVSWKAVSNANGYEIYRATSKNGTYKNIKTITSGKTTSYTGTGLTSKKTYYYKIRAYKTVNGKKVYSSYSSVKSIKVK